MREAIEYLKHACVLTSQDERVEFEGSCEFGEADLDDLNETPPELLNVVRGNCYLKGDGDKEEIHRWFRQKRQYDRHVTLWAQLCAPLTNK